MEPPGLYWENGIGFHERTAALDEDGKVIPAGGESQVVAGKIIKPVPGALGKSFHEFLDGVAGKHIGHVSEEEVASVALCVDLKLFCLTTRFSGDEALRDPLVKGIGRGSDEAFTACDKINMFVEKVFDEAHGGG